VAVDAADPRRVDEAHLVEELDRAVHLDVARRQLPGRQLVSGGHPVDQLVDVHRHRRELAGVAGPRRPLLRVLEHQVGGGRHVSVHRGQSGLLDERVDE